MMRPTQPTRSTRRRHLLVGLTAALSLSACGASYSRSVSSSGGSSCPPANTEVPYAKLLHNAYALDYDGCPVTTTVELLNGMCSMVAPPNMNNKFQVTAKPPGSPDATPVLGIVLGACVVLPNTLRDQVLSKKFGDQVKVRGKTDVTRLTNGGTQAVFLVDSVVPDQPKP